MKCICTCLSHCSFAGRVFANRVFANAPHQRACKQKLFIFIVTKATRQPATHESTRIIHILSNQQYTTRQNNTYIHLTSKFIKNKLLIIKFLENFHYLAITRLLTQFTTPLRWKNAPHRYKTYTPNAGL